MALIRTATAGTEALKELRERLDRFYAATQDYTAFQATSDHAGLHRMMDPILNEILSRKSSATVLEVGAGLTGYAAYVKSRGIKDKVVFHAQDVTPANLKYLQANSDKAFISDIATIPGPYDLIFSYYVLEHVSNPPEFLANVDRLLAPGGTHVVVCPRYDLPFYICPSLRHLRGWPKLKSQLHLIGSRFAAALDGRLRFWVNDDPSMFHGPWYRDSDAVHLVSRRDVHRWHVAHNYHAKELGVSTGSNWRDQLRLRGLTLHGAWQKPVAS